MYHKIVYLSYFEKKNQHFTLIFYKIKSIVSNNYAQMNLVMKMENTLEKRKEILCIGLHYGTILSIVAIC